MNSTSRSLLPVLAALSLTAVAGSASAQVVFQDDFSSGSATAEWSDTSIFTTPSGENLLGRFSNNQVSLSLTGLPSHDSITLSLRLWIMNTMDGSEPIQITAGDTLLMDSTFANFFGGQQFYPNARGTEPTSPAGTGSIGGSNPLQMSLINGLDMGSSGYDLSFTLPHDASSLTIVFAGSAMQGVADESWGLDNVKVTAVPTPGASLLALAGGSLIARRRRAR